MKKLSINNCRVCGLFIEEPPWGEDGETPTYEICPCCGVEFGNEDYSLESLRTYRNKWFDKHIVWFEDKEKPGNWNLYKQMQNIPDDFR